MNKVELVGRLTKELELQKTKNGTSVCRYTLAVNRRKNKDGSQDADFINCESWKQTADYLYSYAHKGALLSVCGSIRTGNYEKDGRRVYTTVVLTDDVNILRNTQDAHNGSYGAENEAVEETSASDETPTIDSDLLPF